MSETEILVMAKIAADIVINLAVYSLLLLRLKRQRSHEA